MRLLSWTILWFTAFHALLHRHFQLTASLNFRSFDNFLFENSSANAQKLCPSQHKRSHKITIRFKSVNALIVIATNVSVPWNSKFRIYENKQIRFSSLFRVDDESGHKNGFFFFVRQSQVQEAPMKIESLVEWIT